MIQYYGQYLVADTEANLLATAPQAGQIGFPIDTKIRLLYDGSSWKPNTAVQILRGVANVNALATGATLIYTIPSTSFRFIPLGAHIEVISVTGTAILAPSISAGTNATSYNNMFTTTAISSLLNTVGLTQPNALTPAAMITPLVSGNTVYAKVNTAATGYTTYTLRIDILGYWEI